MGLNDTPSGVRVHIGFFGRRNAGKSSIVNAVTGQNLSVVSDVLGTTTDPVSKSMELLPMGPVTVIDTPGFDDLGELGALRVQQTRRVLEKTDVAVLVTDGTEEKSQTEAELISLFKERNIPYIIAVNKSDLSGFRGGNAENEIAVSAKTKSGIFELKEKIAALSPKEAENTRIISDKLTPGSVVVLVTPIDEAAPKGRMILPQQQTMRDILDYGSIPVLCREFELERTLNALKNPPAMVITDSQAFGVVSKIVPESVPLTSFSILFARFKGYLEGAVKGAFALEKLQGDEKILISEGCTHHRQCGDIGTVKLPNWIKNFTGKEFEFEFTSGGTFPSDLSPYALVVHCGGCMLNAREVTSRMHRAETAGVPMTNYGVLIAHMHGILTRSLSVFPELLEDL